MKKQILCLLGMVAILAIFAISLQTLDQTNVNFPAQEGNNNPSTKFMLETSFPKLDNTLPALVIKTPTVTSEYVENIGDKFGFTGKAGSAGTRKIGMLNEDETGQLLVYEESGAIWYALLSKIGPVVSSQPNLPSDNEAIKIAENFLLEKDLLPADAKFDKVLADKQLKLEKGTDDIIEEYTVTLQAISSTRQINDIPIVGPGNELKVYIGENGEVVGLFYAWRDIELSKDVVSIKTAETAYNELTAGKSMFITPNLDQANKVNVKNIYLAYWINPANKRQEYALPVYVFEGEVLNSEFEKVPFKGYVPATSMEEYI